MPSGDDDERPVRLVTDEENDAKAPLSVVGIGASAGGLEALSALLQRVTIDGAAFIVVQHLARHQTSVLTELLGRASALSVVTATDGAQVEPNHVYVAPPDAALAIVKGSLRLAPLSSEHDRPQLPIDSFFRSLAEDRGPNAIGVVLSGTGTDGSFGLAAIKSAGGITFAQDPATAKFDGMPRSALESGVADYCLAPEAIADEIRHLGEHPYLRRRAPALQLEEHMGKLAALIKGTFGIDLTHYKTNTIERRLQRRMALNRIQRVGDYLRACQNDPKELAALHHDLLINVTSFFRDREPFEVLEQQILPRILARKKDGNDFIRVWVPGCASGEETYSIAICLIELMERMDRNLKVQIFGTDVDGEAIQQARRGTYAPNIAADVSEERMRRFFVKTDDGRYQVSRRVRDLIVFSNQNLSRDAPFSRLDLVSCRNVLIYLQAAIQRKVLRILHYALLPEGFLMLGTSETVGESADLFSLIDRKNKIYAAKHVALATGSLDLALGATPATPLAEPVHAGGARPIVKIAHLADRKILDQYAPPGVVVNENLEILYFRGRTNAYLEQPSGVATHNILRMVRPELHAPLKHAIEATLAGGEATTGEAQLRDGAQGFHPVTLIVHLLNDPETKARCLLILFKESRDGNAPATASEAPPPVAGSGSADERVQQMAHELMLTKDYLQSTIEELERTNEDLKSANEELQSSNEELQSTNEELETSKEELQSTNEELITLNEELHNRMRDLSASNDDLHNVLLGIDRPVIIVGMDLRIRRFTLAAERVLNLIPADIGRSLSQVSSFLGGMPLDKIIGNVMAQVAAVEHEVQATDRRWYRLRIAPYKTLDLSIRGAVLTFIDIDVQKQRSELLRAVDDYAAEFLAAIQHPLVILNKDLAIVWANEHYYEAFGVLRDEIIGARLESASDGQWDNATLKGAVKNTIASGVPFQRIEVEVATASGEKRVSVAGSRVRNVANESVLVLLSIEGDIIVAREP